MKNLNLYVLVLLMFQLKIIAQKTATDSISQNTTTNMKQIDLLGDLMNSTNEEIQLLPTKFPLTQRLLWGENGLMRNIDAFNLSVEEREKELKIRRTMLASHQALGFATLGAMIAQGVVGAKLYNGDYQLKDTHEALAGAVNIGYFSTAALAMFTPPKAIDERKGYSSIKVHKALAYVHFTSMLLTNILADKAKEPAYRPYHRAAAYTAFGSFAAAMIIIKF